MKNQTEKLIEMEDLDQLEGNNLGLYFKEKDEWELTPKYYIGNKRDSDENDE